MFSVAVQPPSQARANTRLYPPLIAMGYPSGTTEADVPYLFATAVLRDSEGNLIPEQLIGTLTAGGACAEDRRLAGTSQPIVFMFPNLSVAYEGSYSIRVDVYRVDFRDAQGAILVDQVESRTFDVYDVDVPSQKPCESRFLPYMGTIS
jgi:hypothetical protein